MLASTAFRPLPLHRGLRWLLRADRGCSPRGNDNDGNEGLSVTWHDCSPKVRLFDGAAIIVAEPRTGRRDVALP
jgi:hypothetical protein